MFHPYQLIKLMNLRLGDLVQYFLSLNDTSSVRFHKGTFLIGTKSTSQKARNELNSNTDLPEGLGLEEPPPENKVTFLMSTFIDNGSAHFMFCLLFLKKTRCIYVTFETLAYAFISDKHRNHCRVVYIASPIRLHTITGF